MALIRRGSFVYAYRSVKRDGRVRRIYVGSGPVALLAEQQAQRERSERQAARKAHRQAVASTIARLQAVTDLVSRASQRLDRHFSLAMAFCGWQLHHRSWR